ncbi:hypothetical protein [Pararhodobacter sp.]|uniref:hypothetical protein n=1 Tax=Pararhodobacter sp. TaxID=2127056 RepID=UPI002FE0E03A
MTRAMARPGRRNWARLAGLTLLALGCGGGTALAETEFLGGGFLVVKYDSCAEYGWTGTHQVLARLAPQGAPGNPEDQTQIALLLSTGTIAFRYDNVRRYRYTQTIDEATYVWNGPWSPEEPTMNFYYHYVGNIPSADDTAIDNLVLVFNNFNEHPGCQVDAYLALRRN